MSEGKLIGIEMTGDDRGRQVMRVTVDFYDGAAPDLSFRDVWSRATVRIVKVDEPEQTVEIPYEGEG